jgi:protein-tyrosine phosphatase
MRRSPGQGDIPTGILFVMLTFWLGGLCWRYWSLRGLLPLVWWLWIPPLLWMALNWLWVGAAYLGLGPALLCKRSDGSIPLLVTGLLFPYLALTWFSWRLRCLLDARGWVEVTPGLFLGRRVNAHELPPDISMVVDFTAEFVEPMSVRTLSRYRCLPTLDGCAPGEASFRALVDEVARESGRVYVHCAVGHGRSATFVVAVLLARGLEQSVDEAEAKLKRLRPGVRLRSSQRALVGRLAKPS